MKYRYCVATPLAALLLGTTAMATPQTADTQVMSHMPGMQHGNEAKGVGIVRAIDPARGSITLQHQAIAAIGWPAMTMDFKVASPALLKTARVGDTVRFSLHPDGMDSTVTAIEIVPR